MLLLKIFKILNTSNNKYLAADTLRNIFPYDPITKQYIDFCRLRPKISDSIPGEHIKTVPVILVKVWLLKMDHLMLYQRVAIVIL